MHYPKIKIIEPVEFQSYFQLLENNRTRLERFFPKTIMAVQNEKQALAHLEKLKLKHAQKEIYPFGIYVDGKLMGWISAKNFDWRIPKCELGYYVDQAFAGKGITTKAVAEICKFCFEELAVEKIFLRTGVDNIASQKVALKNGFVKEGLLRNEFRIETGALVDTVYFGKIRTT